MSDHSRVLDKGFSRVLYLFFPTGSRFYIRSSGSLSFSCFDSSFSLHTDSNSFLCRGCVIPILLRYYVIYYDSFSDLNFFVSVEESLFESIFESISEMLSFLEFTIDINHSNVRKVYRSLTDKFCLERDPLNTLGV